MRALPSTQFGPAAADLDAAARDRLADLAALRRAVTGSAFPTERVGSAYTAVIEVFLALEGAAFTAAPAPLLRAANDAVTVAAAKEQVRRQHATVAAVLIGGPTTALLEAARSAALADLGTAASPSLRERWAATVAGAEVDARQRIEQRVLTAMTRGEPLPTAQAGEWDRAAGRTAALIRDVEVAGSNSSRPTGPRSRRAHEPGRCATACWSRCWCCSRWRCWSSWPGRCWCRCARCGARRSRSPAPGCPRRSPG